MFLMTLFLGLFSSFSYSLEESNINIIEGMVRDLVRQSISQDSDIEDIRTTLNSMKQFSEDDIRKILEKSSPISFGVSSFGEINGSISFLDSDSGTGKTYSYIPGINLGSSSFNSSIYTDVNLGHFSGHNTFTFDKLGSKFSNISSLSIFSANLSIFYNSVNMFNNSSDRLNIFNPRGILRARDSNRRRINNLFINGISLNYRDEFGFYIPNLHIFLANGDTATDFNNIFTITFNNRFLLRGRDYYFDLNINIYEFTNGTSRETFRLSEAKGYGVASISSTFGFNNTIFSNSKVSLEYATNISTTNLINSSMKSSNIVPFIKIGENSAILLDIDVLYQGTLRINCGLVEYGEMFDKLILDSDNNPRTLRGNSNIFNILSRAPFGLYDSIAFSGIRIFEDRYISPTLFYAISNSHLNEILNTFGASLDLNSHHVISNVFFAINSRWIISNNMISLFGLELYTDLYFENYLSSDNILFNIRGGGNRDITFLSTNNIAILFDSTITLNREDGSNKVLRSLYHLNIEYIKFSAYNWLSFLGVNDTLVFGLDLNKESNLPSSGYGIYGYAELNGFLFKSLLSFNVAALIGFEDISFKYGLKFALNYSVHNLLGISFSIASLESNGQFGRVRSGNIADLNIRSLSKFNLLEDTRISLSFNFSV